MEINPIFSITFTESYPAPSKSDFDTGYMLRYFAVQANSSRSEIIEIDKQTYQSIQTNPLYVTIQIEWIIIGQNVPTYNGNILAADAVSIANQKSIDFVKDKIPNLDSKLPNKLQFWRGY